MMSSLRIWLGALLLVGLILLQGGRLVLEGISRWPPAAPGSNPVSRWERRFEGLRKALSPAAVICYYSPDPEPAYGAQHFLAQYALAPVILVRGTKCPLVVVVFSRPPKDLERFLDRRFTLVRDFGAGVVLLQRRGR